MWGGVLAANRLEGPEAIASRSFNPTDRLRQPARRAHPFEIDRRCARPGLALLDGLPLHDELGADVDGMLTNAEPTSSTLAGRWQPFDSARSRIGCCCARRASERGRSGLEANTERARPGSLGQWVRPSKGERAGAEPAGSAVGSPQHALLLPIRLDEGTLHDRHSAPIGALAGHDRGRRCRTTAPVWPGL